MDGSSTLDKLMHVNTLRGMNATTLLHHGWPALARRLPMLTSIVLGLLTAWLLAVLTWALVPRPQTAQPIYRHDAAAPAATPTDTGAELAAMHLFGTPATGGVNAPETTLNLTLHGIAAGRHGESFAIIAASGVGNVYAVGAQLPGGAKVQSIFPDHVLLNLNGQLQSLSLPKTSGGSGAGATPIMEAAPPIPQTIYGRPLPAEQNLDQLRNEIVQHPERLLDMMRAMPVMQNGKLEGYRVFPVGNSNAFSQLGLQPGDIVTSVNGVPLNNPAQSMQVLNNIRTSSQVSVTFTRNGQQETKILQFQNNGATQR